MMRLVDLALGLLVCAAVATFAGRLFWLLDLAAHFQVYYFCAAVILVLLNIVLRRKRQAIIAVALVAAGVFHLGPYYLPTNGGTAGGLTYKVMLLNLNFQNQKIAALKEEIARTDADILVLQEVTPRLRRELGSIASKYRHSFDLPEEGAFGLWVLSKFKFVDVDVQRRDEIAFLHLKYEVAGEPLEVVALHPFPPMSGRGSKVRNRILEDAAVYASGSGARMTVGDLNCSPWSPYFRSFIKTSGLRDSALGLGVQSTWFPARPLGIPIDHVLVSPEIEVVDRRVGGDVGSDHRAVVVEFRMGSSKT